MFSAFGHSQTIVDPQQDRDPPPLPTIVLFPHEKLHTDESWSQHPPDLYKEYTHVQKPYDLKAEHLKALNISIQEDVPLEVFIPQSSDGLRHLPPREWGAGAVGGAPARRNSTTSYEIFAHDRYPLLSNGVHAPELDTYVKFTHELVCDNDDGFAVIGKQKPKSGHKPPTLAHYRRFWGVLETMSTYWDASLDSYFESRSRPAAARTKSGGLFKSLKIGGGGHNHKAPLTETTEKPMKRYRGRRTDCGANMPDHFRSDCIRNFIDPIATAFGCTIAVPRKGPQVKVKNMLIPVTQTVIVWRNPQDKAQKNQGVVEGPLIGVQCRGATNFPENDRAATVDAAREIGGLLLLAQERAREGKPKVVPGQGKWYTTKPRWGGGPGGAFGDADKNGNGTASSDVKMSQTSVSAGGNVSIRFKPSEEFIWKQLKPAPGLWETSVTYLAVGKERGAQYDNVFMISSLYHHIAIVKLTVHPLYLDFMSEGTFPTTQPDSTWYKPTIQRTKWYDLFIPEDRAEAMRALWGVFSYMMRAGPTARRPILGERQRSEVMHKIHFSRKKHHEVAPEDDYETPRSQSLF